MGREPHRRINLLVLSQRAKRERSKIENLKICERSESFLIISTRSRAEKERSEVEQERSRATTGQQCTTTPPPRIRAPLNRRIIDKPKLRSRMTMPKEGGHRRDAAQAPKVQIRTG